MSIRIVNEIVEKYIEGSPQIAETAVNPDEGSDDSSEQIRGANAEDSTIQEGTITYDIRFWAIVPRTGENIRLIVNIDYSDCTKFFFSVPHFSVKNRNNSCT